MPESHEENPKDLEGFREIHVAEGPFQADIILQALEREGIKAVCRHHEEIAYDGLFVAQRGWGTILVPSSLAPRARELVREVLAVYGREGEEPESPNRAPTGR